MFFYYRKNSEAFDKETRNDNIDITDVDVSADLFGKLREKRNEFQSIHLFCFPSDIVRQSFYGEFYCCKLNFVGLSHSKILNHF